MTVCYKCGVNGHKSINCTVIKQTFKSQIKCFGCNEMVNDLKLHKTTCNGTTIPKTTAGVAQSPSTFKSEIKCYGCNEMVVDLKVHKLECKQPKVTNTDNSTSVGKDSNNNNNVVSDESNTSSTSTTFVNKKDYQDVYFLIDCSGSMIGSRIENAKQSLLSVVEDLDVKDRMAIITFDTSAFFKLQPRPVEEILRKKDLPNILKSIKIGGRTAIYDAIVLAVNQLHDKTQKTLIIVLTDGEDNSSKHTFQETHALLSEHQNISLNIVEVDGNNQNYSKLCSATKSGVHTPNVTSEEIKSQFPLYIKKLYRSFK